MVQFFLSLSPVMQALVATTFTWLMTALGASLVFFFRHLHKTWLDAMLGLAAGVMIAASFWSLLAPGISLAEELGMVAWAVAAVGLVAGGLLLLWADLIYGKMQARYAVAEELGSVAQSTKKRSALLFFSITLHNIPEGLVVGVGFGALAHDLPGATLTAACMLGLGIGLQNFPEGAAVSMALRREGYGAKKAFFYGQLSGIVEPISGVIGALLAMYVRSMLPFLLSFAAGAMLYVVVQELIPESQKNQRKNIMALATLVGFSIMMILDVALG